MVCIVTALNTLSAMYHRNKVTYHINPFSTQFLALLQSYAILLLII